jgi:hypothetical protein
MGGLNYYFKAGALDQDRYLLSTTDLTASADVYFEVVDGGYNIYFMDGETKTYSYLENAEPNEGEKYYFVSYNSVVALS